MRARLHDPMEREETPEARDPSRSATDDPSTSSWGPSPEDHAAAAFPPDLPSKIKVRSQALLSTLQALSHASSKISASSAALQGDTRTQNLAAQVEARRAQAFAELSKLFRVDCVSGGRQERQERQERQVWQVWQERQERQERQQRKATSDLAILDFDSQWSGFGSVSATPHPDGATAEEIPRVTICDCVIDPSTWQHVFDDGDDAPDRSPETDRETSIALCYAAEIVYIASTIMDVPLRYPVTLRGSYSTISDAEPGVAGGRTFPLFIDSTKDSRAKFAIAVFLLNKNINLLASHLAVEAGAGRSATESTKDSIGLALVRLLAT